MFKMLENIRKNVADALTYYEMDFLVNIREFKDLLNRENVYFFLLILVIFLDRVSKNIIIQNFDGNSYYVNDYINLDLIWNIGIGFGILAPINIDL